MHTYPIWKCKMLIIVWPKNPKIRDVDASTDVDIIHHEWLNADSWMTKESQGRGVGDSNHVDLSIMKYYMLIIGWPKYSKCRDVSASLDVGISAMKG